MTPKLSLAPRMLTANALMNAYVKLLALVFLIGLIMPPAAAAIACAATTAAAFIWLLLWMASRDND